jgi:hypothetical protein
MHGLQIWRDMYGVPVLMFGVLVSALVLANYLAERKLKPRPLLRRRMYAFLNSLGYAWLGTIALAMFIGAVRASYFFPLFLLLALMRWWFESKFRGSA